MCLPYMKTLLHLFLLFIFLAACEPSSLEPAQAPLETKILIQPKEELKDGKRSIVLLNKTEKIYPCINFSIWTDQAFTDRSFKITFTGVEEENICATALGPATSSVDLGSIPNGDYYIELNNGNIKNKGLLSVTNREVELVFAQQNGIEIVVPKLMRVPENSYWGIVGYHNQDAAGLVNEFVNELKALGAEFNKQNSGDYWHYQVGEEGEMKLPENHGYYFAEPVLFQYRESEADLKELIRSFGEQHQGKVYLYFNSYKGEQIDGRGK